MDVKVSLIAAGISDAETDYWKTMYCRYNRIHVPLEGKAIYHDVNGDRLLGEHDAYFLVNSYAPNLEVFSDRQYYHMYIDFQTEPPLLSREILEIDLSEDSFFLYLVKAVQTLIQENIRLHGLHKISRYRDKYYAQQIKRVLQAMVSHLQERYHIEAVENPKIESAIRFIEDHYTEPLRNEDIAAALHVDTRHLIRLFTEYMGTPPYQYLTQYRIEQAINELRNGKTVNETAYLCGYQSETAFRRAFKRITGCSPTEYLKN